MANEAVKAEIFSLINFLKSKLSKNPTSGGIKIHFINI
jgi:hypothetical protein